MIHHRISGHGVSRCGSVSCIRTSNLQPSPPVFDLWVRSGAPRSCGGIAYALVFAGLSMIAASGCQSVPTIRGQSPDGVTALGAEYMTPEFEDVISEIVVEGNSTIETGAVLAHVRSQAGRPVDERQIKEDLRGLYATRWFYSVERRFRMSEDGLQLVFRVIERPVVRSIAVKGNRNFSTRQVLKQITIEEGSPYDVASNRSAARKIERFYQDKKSYPLCKVSLESGGDPDDRDVVFVIEEGPFTVVRDTEFVGNEDIKSSLLRLKLKTKRTMLGWIVNFSPFGSLFGGKFNESTLPQDVVALKEYYHNLGYFDVQITKDVRTDEGHLMPQIRLVKSPFKRWRYEHLPIPYMRLRKTSGITYQYAINEGTRYRVRNIEVEGNRVFRENELLSDFELEEGGKFNARYLNADVDAMREKYGERGHLFAKIDAVPRTIDGEEGVVDVVYQIDEDRPYTIRRINVHIDAPGGSAHTRESVVLHRALVSPGEFADPNLIEKSKGRLGGMLFERGAKGPRIQISRVKHEEPAVAAGTVTRGQNPLDSQPRPYDPLLGNGNLGDPYGGLRNPFTNAIERPGEADLDIFVTEAQTGRLMFGVGVNSNAGVVGSFVIEENNFDITRWPTSFRDFWDGEAFRGNGERFRIEAVPGEFISRYMASWQTANFLDTDFSFGVSGFFYQRFLPGWDEERLGGRLSLGYQIDKWWSATVALRLEDVTLSRFSLPAAALPPVAMESAGSNFLSTVRTSIANDTRDSAFLPTEGHFVEFAFEQAFGDFMYPRLEVQGTQHFKTYERADGGGRHVLTLHGEMSWTDSDTPLFERYFAGGYQSFRGFDFRGVSPMENGMRVGGDAMILASAEYSVPITADEMVRVVGFVDTGTVEQTEDDISADTFRATAGLGLRLTIPALGSAPLAFDFGFPILSEPFDNERVFSFYIGLTR